MPPPRRTKIFDPADGFAPLEDPWVVTDSTLAFRDGRWWMFLAGKLASHPSIALFSASLPPGAPLSATGWALSPHAGHPKRVALLAAHERSSNWDLAGGRHCPSYVAGVDPRTGLRVERIYYAGGAASPWGPYAIGFLEWDGAQWVDQDAPAFVAEEPWEQGSVYEPNLVWADSLWRMWYVAGSNPESYLVHGCAESADGRTGWRNRRVFFPPEDGVFDFAVTESPGGGYEAVFSRVWLGKDAPPPTSGLWWCHAPEPSPEPQRWGAPVQILTAEDRGWHAGPWKPCLRYGTDPNRMFVFFDGKYTVPDRPGFPFVFTLGCLEIDRPA